MPAVCAAPHLAPLRPPVIGFGRRRRSRVSATLTTLKRSGGHKKWLTKNPHEEVRIGTVKAAIWQNDVAGKTRYNVTFSRIYRDAEGQWKTAQSFGRNDLLVLAKVADRAHSRIFELQRTEDESEQAA